MIEISDAELKERMADYFVFIAQVRCEYEFHGMHYQLNSLLHDDQSPLYKTLEGLCKLRMNRDLLATFKFTGVAIIEAENESNDSFFEIILRTDEFVDADVNARTIYSLKCADKVTISLPSETEWEDCGLGWLNRCCLDCCEDGVEDMPWFMPRCECANSDEDAGE